MSDIKIDTFRSLVFDRTLSDEETESETIDDFSQHSDMNNLMPDKFSVNSRSETPVFKNVSIVVSRNDNEIEEKVSRSPSFIEEKDNSEDLMVEISKKTTIKKIISKTTLVNGITKASEFEEFIIKDDHINDHSNKHQKIKFDKEQAYVDFQKAMGDKITNEEIVRESHTNPENSIFEKIEPVYVQNTLQDRKLSNKSSESFSQTFGESKENYISGKLKSQSENIDKFSDSNNHGKKNELNTGEKFNERKNSKDVNKFNERKDLNSGDQFFESKKPVHNPKSKRNFNNSDISKEKIIPSEKLRENIKLKNEKENNSKTKTLNRNDNNLSKEKTSLNSIDNNNDDQIKHRDKNYKDYILDYKIRKFSDKNNFTRPYIINYNGNKGRDKCSGDYYRNLKSISVDSKPVINDKLNSNFKHEEKNIKWVDPFKSYHLKYDLKDNGRSMQDWIKQKQDALNKSSSKNSMKNLANDKRLLCKSAAITKTFSIVSPNITGSSHKDIKEFITRGNIKENLFRFRHPYPEVFESSYSFQQSYTDKEEDIEKFYNSGKLKSYESLYGNNKTDEFMSDEKSNDDFNLQDSEIWNSFDSNEQYMEPTSASLRDQNQYQNQIDIYRNCCHGTLCCCSPYYNCYKCLCMPCNCLSLNENHIKTPRYISYESPNLSLTNERKTTNNFHKRSLMLHSSPETFNHNPNEQFSSEESEMNKPISNNREIDILESRLNTIENKIRNMKLNGPNVYDCEMDLECQRRDIEKQLDCLYMFIPTITSKSSIKTY